MMIFLTIIFLLTGLYVLFNGQVFAETNKELRLLNIRKENGENAEKKIEEVFRSGGCLFLIIAIFMFIAEIIYFSRAISYDTYKIPTLIAIFYWVISNVGILSKKSVKNMTLTERMIEKEKLENLKSNITFRSISSGLFNTVYYGYMLWILIS